MNKEFRYVGDVSFLYNKTYYCEYVSSDSNYPYHVFEYKGSKIFASVTEDYFKLSFVDIKEERKIKINKLNGSR